MSTVGQSPSYNMASVLFMDIVSYSFRSIDDQTEVLTIPPVSPAKSALEVAASLRSHPEIRLPMGQYTGLWNPELPRKVSTRSVSADAPKPPKSPTSTLSRWKWPVGAGIPQPERKLRYYMAVQKYCDGRDGPARLDPGQEIQIPPGGDFVFDKQKGRERSGWSGPLRRSRSFDALRKRRCFRAPD
jgi:hypothetical protein